MFSANQGRYIPQSLPLCLYSARTCVHIHKRTFFPFFSGASVIAILSAAIKRVSRQAFVSVRKIVSSNILLETSFLSISLRGPQHDFRKRFLESHVLENELDYRIYKLDF